MDEELNIIIEEYPIFEDDDCVGTGEDIIINGDRVRRSGSTLRSVLEHLGYVVDISYH